MVPNVINRGTRPQPTTVCTQAYNFPMLHSSSNNGFLTAQAYNVPPYPLSKEAL